MDSIFDHYKKTGYLHHAHLIEGGVEVAPLLVAAIEKHLGVAAQGNPDVAVETYESFGIDEARALAERSARAAFGNGARLPSPNCSNNEAMCSGGQARKFFIIATASFTREAQNALLKTFEEPTAGTHFFIILPHLDTILPTLKSRVMFAKANTHAEDDTKNLAEKFLDSTLEKRLALAKKIGEMHDREKARRIVDHMERILYTRLAGKPDHGVFREIFQTKTYLADRGSSPKMLMEHLAIAMLY